VKNARGNGAPRIKPLIEWKGFDKTKL